jgi:hypothetical protein
MKFISSSEKILKHALLVILGAIVVFMLLFLWLHGSSGGDIGILFFGKAFLIIYTITLGMYSYDWKFKSKMGIISGLLASYMLAFLMFAMILN